MFAARCEKLSSAEGECQHSNYMEIMCVHHVLTINKLIQSDLQKIIVLVHGWLD